MVRSVVNGRPLETTGDHRGQFPRTDFAPAAEIYSSNNDAWTPKATLVRGITMVFGSIVSIFF